jgi:hypothetical protein
LARLARLARTTGAIAKAQARAHALLRDARNAAERVSLNGLSSAYANLAAYAAARRS